jgi:hypothetical protein
MKTVFEFAISKFHISCKRPMTPKEKEKLAWEKSHLANLQIPNPLAKGCKNGKNG